MIGFVLWPTLFFASLQVQFSKWYQEPAALELSICSAFGFKIINAVEVVEWLGCGLAPGAIWGEVMSSFSLVLGYCVSSEVHMQNCGSKADSRYYCLGIWKLLKADPNIVFLVQGNVLYTDHMNRSDSSISQGVFKSLKEVLHASKLNCHKCSLTFDSVSDTILRD